jgi:hypothetical protein
MIDASIAIRRARRGRLLARLTRLGLFVGALAGVLLMRGDTLPLGTGLLFGTIMAGFLTASKSARTQHGLVQADALLEAGEPAEADRLLGVVLRRVSVIARHWTIALRLLALARAGQGRGEDARRLAAEALRPRGLPKAEADGLRLLLAAGALDSGDLPAAHAALSHVAPPLSLADSLRVLELQTDYCLRVGAWPHAMADLPQKVELAELMPADTAASVQAMLALAARRLGQTGWADWLTRRAALLCDPATLVRRRPALGELFGTTNAG